MSVTIEASLMTGAMPNEHNYSHYLSFPFENIEVRGPQLLLLGKLTIPELIKGEQYSDSLFKKIGFNDQFSTETTKSLIKKMLNFKNALEKNIFVIIGDHGVTQLIDGTKKAVSVDLHQLYNQYNIASLSQTLTTDELAFGNNHRMAYIYPLKDDVLIPKLAEQALTDSRIDIIAYLDDKQKEWIHVITPNSSTSFRFKKEDQ